MRESTTEYTSKVVVRTQIQVVIIITSNVKHGGAELRNLLWPKLLSVAPICRCPGPSPSPITLPLSFPEADPVQAGLVGCFPASPT